jgi:hypothetical protein
VLPPEHIDLRNFESPASVVSVIGFAALFTTVVVGLIAYVALDVAKLETNTFREWLQVAGEIGLLACRRSDRS